MMMEIAFVFIQKETGGGGALKMRILHLVYFASHLWSRSRKTKIHYCQTLAGYSRAIERTKFDLREAVWMRMSEVIGKDEKQVWTRMRQFKHSSRIM